MKIFKLVNNKRGQGLMEYLILVALIAVVSIGAVRIVGRNVSVQYERFNRAMGAPQQDNLTIRSAGDKINQRNLSDFLENAR